MNVKDRLKIMDEIDAANKQHIEDWKKANKVRGILLDVANEQVKVITVDKDLKAYYKAINCRCIDIVRRRIGARSFEIICDDEGALVDNPKISAISKAGNGAIVGNLLIVGFDGYEDICSLTDAEIAYILPKIGVIHTLAFPNGYPILTRVDY